MKSPLSVPVELYFPRGESLPAVFDYCYAHYLGEHVSSSHLFVQRWYAPSSFSFLSRALRGPFDPSRPGRRHRGSIFRNEKRQRVLCSRREIEKGGKRFTSSLRSTLSGWLSLSSVVPLLTLEFSSTYVQRIFNRIPLYCTILLSPLCRFSFSYLLLRLLFRCFFLFLLVGFVGRFSKICGGSGSDWNRETARLEQRERWRMISFAGWFRVFPLRLSVSRGGI